MKNYQYIEVARQHDGIILWLNNPSKRNTISTTVIKELIHFFLQPSEDACFLVMAGRGECFAAGADLVEMVEVSESQALEISKTLHYLLTLMGQYSVPVIAAVHGYAIGGGLELALGADMIFTTESAWFSLPELGFSLIPGGGATQNLSKTVGRRNALFQMLTAKRINSNEALHMGIVQRVFPDEQFFTIVMDFVSSMFKPLSFHAVVALKKAVRAAGTSQGYAVEAEQFSHLLGHDAKLLIQKFLANK